MNAIPEPTDTTPPPAVEVPRRIGLIAGQGDFPLLIARSAAASGTEVVALCIKDFASQELPALCAKAHWIELGQLNRAIELLHEENLTAVTMAGRVHHNSVFQYRHFDWRAMKMLARAASKRADALLQTVCDEFARDGITVMESSMFLRSLMPQAGLLTPTRPLNPVQQADLDFGIPIAQVIAGQDIGQTIVVKDKLVIAVEGLEGTDLCIGRAGELAGEGCVVIKTAKPNQDLRFDVPVVGPGTIKSMRNARASVLALSAGRSLIFHKERVIREAEEAGICVVIFPDTQPAASAEIPKGSK